MPSLDPETTILTRRAVAGDIDALNEVVARFAPALLALARHKLGDSPRMACDPEDLVADTWIRALPRLNELEPRNGRITPVIMRFLSTTLVNRYLTMLQKHVLGKPARVGIDEPDGALSAAGTSALSRLGRDERRNAVHDAIARLGKSDAEIVYLRAIQQIPSQEVAELVGVTPGALKVRYCRALKKLREVLPDSLFTDLDDE